MLPRLEIDLPALESNTRRVVETCRLRGIQVWGVTKGVRGCPRVGLAMLRGGVEGLADSRLPNLIRLRQALGDPSLMLLRPPSPAQAQEAVGTARVSLNSEILTLTALGLAAAARKVEHEVILMVDLGDRREGVLPGDVLELARAARRERSLRLAGIGANFACFGGVLPTAESLVELVELAGRVRMATGASLDTVSGGNSSSLPLVIRAAMPAGVNQLRIGEGILLGRDPSTGEPLPGTRQDVFRLEAELIEVQRKPSAPCGPVARNAFGRQPVHIDRGDRLRALAAIGVQEIGAGTLCPASGGVEVLGASSDHLVLDVTAMEPAPRPGGRLQFLPDYGAVLALMMATDVCRQYRE